MKKFLLPFLIITLFLGIAKTSNAEIPQMEITNILPNSGSPGDKITIIGKNFTSKMTFIDFNGTPAISWVDGGPTKIYVFVPSGATTGKIKIKNEGMPNPIIESANNFIINSENLVWYFTNKNYQIVGEKGINDSGGFIDKESCLTELKKHQFTYGVHLCEQTSKDNLVKLTKEAKNQYNIEEEEKKEISPQTNKGYNEKEYELLAPIGDFNKITDEDNIGDYLNTIFKIIIGLCGVLAVIMIIIGGIQYMGQESVFGKSEAKGRITAAIGGLLLALGAYILLNTINPDLLGKKGGIQINDVVIEIDEEPFPWSTYEVGDDKNLCPEGYKNILVKGTNPNKINVCGSISEKLTQMINAAAKEKIILSGAGTRSVATQKELRAQNCGGTININNPNAKCNPLTALPGKSNHQKGLAIDFNCNGKTMGESGGVNSLCYKWLKKNAKDYGFYNLASEPWHWSVDGK